MGHGLRRPEEIESSEDSTLAPSSAEPVQCTALDDGPFFCLPVVSSGCNGVELFRAEAIATYGSTQYVALRWYAGHYAVVGVKPGRLARTTIWQVAAYEAAARQAAAMGDAAKQAAAQAAQQPAVDYLYELLASRDELEEAGLSIDGAFWAPEYLARSWARGDHERVRSLGPHADPIVAQIRPHVLKLRKPCLAARPRRRDALPGAELAAVSALRGHQPARFVGCDGADVPEAEDGDGYAGDTEDGGGCGCDCADGNARDPGSSGDEERGEGEDEGEGEGEERPQKRARRACDEAAEVAEMPGHQAMVVPAERPLLLPMDAEKEHRVSIGVELAADQTEGVFHVEVDDLRRPLALVVRPQQQQQQYHVLVESEEPNQCRVLLQAGPQHQRRVVVLPPPHAEMPPASPTPRGESDSDSGTGSSGGGSSESRGISTGGRACCSGSDSSSHDISSSVSAASGRASDSDSGCRGASGSGHASDSSGSSSSGGGGGRGRACGSGHSSDSSSSTDSSKASGRASNASDSSSGSGSSDSGSE
eukprot:m51a1_g5054 hypothetical protein (535) ;mRNA; f:74857-78235